LRVTDACGNATINDASILPLGNTIVKASSDCFYNNISLMVDTIPNAAYSWFKKNSPTDSTLIASSQTYSIAYLLPADTGTYVSVVSVNSGCLTKISTFTVTGACGGALLATNSLSFTGSLQTDNIQLKWTTAKAYDASAFVIEKSIDGYNYKVLGTVNVSARNSVASSQYLFSDVNAVAGSNFYRLRIIRQDGTITYSNIVDISKKGAVSVSVMPNPVADAFTIRFQPLAATNYNVMLLSADGKVVFSSNYTINPGEAKTIQRPGALASGIYYLAVVNKSTNEKDIIKLFFK
jgi:hypothetical protein